MDIGTTLRTARERHDLTVTQLALRTRIPVAILQALEENAFDRAPRGIFTRGFLRAYASEVGLDPRAIVSQFLAESGPVTAGTDTPLASADAIDDTLEVAPLDPDLRASGPGWGYALVVVALIVAVVSVNRSDTWSVDSPEPSVVAQTRAEDLSSHIVRDAAPVETGRPVATTGQLTPPGAPAQATLTSARFQIQAQAPCWVEVVVDGRKVVYRLMLPGERETIDPERELVLRVGDPSALSYFVDGAPGAPLGKPGIPVTVRFTNEGQRIHLAS